MFDRKSLPLSVGVNKCDRKDVCLGVDTSIVAKSEGPLEYRDVYRSPKVNDLEAVFQQFWCFCGREMLVNTSNRSSGRLVDVCLLYRLTFMRTGVKYSRTIATDGCFTR
jgi:hypothetical protein